MPRGATAERRAARAARRRRRSRASAGSTASTTTWSAPTRINVPGHRRGRRAHQGHRSRAGDVGRRQRPLLLSRSAPRRDARRRRGGAQRRLRRARAARRDQLPELRQPRAAGIMWQFAKAVEGIGAACRALDVPITGGNVSLYNETDGKAIYPTPVIGVVGLLEHADRVVSRRFQESGRCRSCCSAKAAASSAAASISRSIHDLVRGVPPALDLDAGRALQASARHAARTSACAFGARLFRRRPGRDRRPNAASTPTASAPTSRSTALRSRRRERVNVAAALFGESASRVIVSVVPEHVTTRAAARAAARRAGARHRPDRRQPPAHRGRRRRS